MSNEVIEVIVLGKVNLRGSKISRAVGDSPFTAFEMVHKHNRHPYKIRLVQELNVDEFNRLLKFDKIIDCQPTFITKSYITADVRLRVTYTLYLNSTSIVLKG